MFQDKNITASKASFLDLVIITKKKSNLRLTSMIRQMISHFHSNVNKC